jgi:hypothetical protein
MAIFAALTISVHSVAQELSTGKNYFISAIGFWNVENLYDTLNDKWKNDEDFTPEGLNAWTGSRYRTKIDHLADAICQMGTEATPDGLAILGVCEIENKNVLNDLIRSPRFKKRNYQFVHIEGPDVRGVDPALLYNPSYFKVTGAASFHVKLVTDSTHKTRDILLVSGLLMGEPVAILVNHWPSRRGGEMLSRTNRNAAARVARRVTDSITTANPMVKVIIMGDLNDDPVNESVKKYIQTYPDWRRPVEGYFFNPMEKLFKSGIGTLAWQDSWNLFDQIMLNKPWLPDKYDTWQYYTAKVFNKPFLKADYGNFKGYPFRTYSGGAYTAGYSDHFASYIIIAREKKQGVGQP